MYPIQGTEHSYRTLIKTHEGKIKRKSNLVAEEEYALWTQNN